MSTQTDEQPSGAIQASWRRFLDTYEPLRPDLYRYCRNLTRSPWDAEDMAQETIARAFASLAIMADPPRNPRAWLFRVASNLWLNRMRQARELPVGFSPELPEPATSAEPRSTREAAGTLLGQLSPQERAALVLKDAFGLSLEEVAEALSTTTGAIKAALHRGRGRLLTPDPDRDAPVAPAVLDAFCDAFNARDLDRLTALLLDTATLEYPGFKIESGAGAVRAGSLQGTLFGCPEGGYDLVAPPRCELRAHRGESIFLWWSGEEVHAVVRVEVDGDRITRLRNYYHAPEVLSEVCRELDVPFRTHGYRPGSA
ncbi:sigma-70 family RNA polymerase sigma factor [Corallococcus llansteffanensis]|uniref:Sigma-70 family RNA polymerase sigma factor n=1 Tax=Corallococcus llansteffanensis TaxID=2316731 RepID=A0A3A8QET7_9BACT|nr:sigma-70 family RNA polymerase sigma factor [Corallococcus llansteffanensis]RKH66161.1 sigma-70 family RNA polymerase sigma factor [Corallococcus llansteffanensis]